MMTLMIFKNLSIDVRCIRTVYISTTKRFQQLISAREVFSIVTVLLCIGRLFAVIEVINFSRIITKTKIVQNNAAFDNVAGIYR